MNKKSFLALSFAAIAIVSGYAGIKAFRSQANGENDLLAQNIEALSESEGSTEPATCYNTITVKDGCQVRYCGSCEYIPGTAPEDASPSQCTKK